MDAPHLNNQNTYHRQPCAFKNSPSPHLFSILQLSTPFSATLNSKTLSIFIQKHMLYSSALSEVALNCVLFLVLLNTIFLIFNIKILRILRLLERALDTYFQVLKTTLLNKFSSSYSKMTRVSEVISCEL